jgi:hypothetical protein
MEIIPPFHIYLKSYTFYQLSQFHIKYLALFVPDFYLSELNFLVISTLILFKYVINLKKAYKR